MSDKHPLISVVVCTYNRSSILALALETLCQQTLDTSLFEVIVVDNNSTDDTRAIIEQFIIRQNNIRYVLETKQGLSQARNRGWQESQADYIAYCDDDCKLPTHWLSVAVKIIEKHNPAIFGGSYIPFYLSERPAWFMDKYGSHIINQAEGALEDDNFLSGGNLFIQARYLLEFNGFNNIFGMNGNRIAYAEETQLINLLKDQDPNALIYFHPELTVEHLVRAKKMSIQWRIKQSFALGRDTQKMHLRNSTRKLSPLRYIGGRFIQLGQITGALLKRILSFPFRNREQYPYWQNYVWEVMNLPVYMIGSLWTQLKYNPFRAKELQQKADMT